MKCFKCKNTAKIESKTEKLCHPCFVKKIEKRARTQLREYPFFKKNDKVLIVDDNSKESKINKFLLPKIIGEFPLTIINKKFKSETEKKEYIKQNKINRIIIPKNANDLVQEKLEKLLIGKKINENKKEITLLGNILPEELEDFAKITKLKYKKEKKKNEKNLIVDEFEKLEEKYPGVKFGFLKAEKELRI